LAKKLNLPFIFPGWKSRWSTKLG